MIAASLTYPDWGAIPTRVYDRPASWPLDDERTTSFFVSTTVFLVLAILATITRFYARKLKNIAWQIDDWLCLAATVIYCGHYGTGVWAIWGGGIGHHWQETTKKEWIVMYKQLLIVQFPYAVEMTLIRLSICILFTRIFVPRWFKRTMYFAMLLSVMWCIYVIVAALAACSPFAANWNRAIPNSHCVSAPIFYTIAAGWAVALDLIIWVAPQTVVWKLQMRLVDKVCVSLIFALAIVDIGVSAVRIGTLATLHLDGDFIFSDTESQLWSAIEPGVAIVVACAPMMRVILDKMLPENAVKRVTRQITSRSSISRSRNDSVSQPSSERPLKEKKHYSRLSSSFRTSRHESTPASTRRHSLVDRETVAMTPNNRPTSKCTAKRVSSNSMFNLFASNSQNGQNAEKEVSGVKWDLNEKEGNQFSTSSSHATGRSSIWRLWQWPRNVVSRTRSRSNSQQFVRVQCDVMVTHDTFPPAITPPPDHHRHHLNTTSSLSPSSSTSSSTGGGTSGLGGDYAQNMSWPELAHYRPTTPLPIPRSP